MPCLAFGLGMASSTALSLFLSNVVVCLSFLVLEIARTSTDCACYLLFFNFAALVEKCR